MEYFAPNRILNSKYRGRGFAVINALKKTNKKYACICSIDNAWDKKFYLSSYKKFISNNNLFCVYGPKNHKGSIQKRPLFRKIISLFSIIFLRIIFFNNIKIDTQCIKMFKINKKFIKKLIPYNYFFDTQFFLTNQNMNLEYNKLPVKVNDNNKNSKVKFYFILEFILEALHYRFVARFI